MVVIFRAHLLSMQNYIIKTRKKNYSPINHCDRPICNLNLNLKKHLSDDEIARWLFLLTSIVDGCHSTLMTRMPVCEGCRLAYWYMVIGSITTLWCIEEAFIR